jgi:hypothetical protein
LAIASTLRPEFATCSDGRISSSMVEINEAQLSGKPERSKTCFAATPIGAEGSPTRERSDRVLDHVIVEVLEPMGYTVTRADKLPEPGSITTQVMSHLVTSDLAIFDLAEHNPNVFYELAIRHAANKPYVQLDDGAKPIPFDITVYRTITFDYHDLRSVDQAKKTLREMVLAYEKGSLVETPLTNVSDVQSLLSAGDPIADQLASIANTTREILGGIQGVHYNNTINFTDVPVLQRFIQAYANAGSISLENRTTLENTLRTPYLKQWARGLPTEAVRQEPS